MAGSGSTRRQLDLHSSPPHVVFVETGTAVCAPEGLVYSTAPKSRRATTGEEYIVKGPDPGMVAAEAVCHILGRQVGLPVPDFALASTEGNEAERLFCSVKLVTAHRDVDPWVEYCLQAITNIIVFDIWVANNDRNIGNLLARSLATSPPTAEIVAIDFEKARTLRSQSPLIETGQLAPGSLWPTGTLGALMRHSDTPSTFLGTIMSTPDGIVERAVQVVAAAVPQFTWGDASTVALTRRRDKLDRLVKEVWPQ